MINFDEKMRTVTLTKALEMQDELLNSFIGEIHDARVTCKTDNHALLLKLTYRALLEDVIVKLRKEVEYNT